MILFPSVPVIGIDPGLSGAVVRIWEGDEFEKEKIVCRRGFKTLADIANGIEHVGMIQCVSTYVIEQVSAMPGQGVCSMFSFGRSTGTAFGTIFSALSDTVYEVAPMKWQNWFTNELGLPKGKGLFDSTKVVPMILSEDLQKPLMFARKKALDHNACDAFLIAVWAANHLGTQTLLERRSEHCAVP